MESLTFFSQMALDLHDAPTAESTIERIAEYAKLAIGCDEAGIMLVHARNQIETAAATSRKWSGYFADRGVPGRVRR